MQIKKSESQEQQTVMAWAEIMQRRYPELQMLFHVPNEGKRSKAAGGQLKAMGLKSGVPDIYLDFPAGKYHGLRIELKVEKNKPTQEQDRWLKNLNAVGYFAAVCYGAAQAERVLEDYIRLKPGHPMALEKYIDPAVGYLILK